MHQIERTLLEKTLKELIETILFCLPEVYKGTFFSIGKPPDLIAERVNTGILDKHKNEVIWGLPSLSDFNSPGKTWNQYRDEPGRPAQPLAWCVLHQQGQSIEDYAEAGQKSNVSGPTNRPHEIYHLEPVLMPKSILDLDIYPSAEYPRDYQNNVIWKESDQAVVAIIKIHFKNLPIRSNSHEIQIINKLANALGTKLLSYQLRQDSIKALQQDTKERLYACNILADSLRNAITKSGLIFSLIKQEIGYLRNQWEQLLFTELQEKDRKKEAIQSLEAMLAQIICNDQALIQDLIRVQNKFLELSLPPEKGENWVSMQIETRWRNLLELFPQHDSLNENILKNIRLLKSSLYFGLDPVIIGKYTKIPFELKKEWIELIYQNLEKFSPNVLNRIIKLLENNSLQIESRERSYRRLVQLKALAETMNQLEHNTNFLLQQVLNGGTEELMAEYINQLKNEFQKRDKGMPEKRTEYPTIPLNS